MDFIINNLAVLLVLIAIAGTLGFYWVCNKAAKQHPMEADWDSRPVTSGRVSCKTPNKSNVPKSMATWSEGLLR